MNDYLLQLYVAGNTARGRRAIAAVRGICAQDLCGPGRMEVIDILAEPQRAEDERILATPTLVRALPLPARRLIGDLTDVPRVLAGLQLKSARDAGIVSAPDAASTPKPP